MNEQPQAAPEQPPADEPPLQFSIGINDYGRIIINFNKQVSWVGLDAMSALDIAMALVNHACAVIKSPPRQPPFQQPVPAPLKPNGNGGEPEDPMSMLER